jgi:hypothetical protein
MNKSAKSLAALMAVAAGTWMMWPSAPQTTLTLKVENDGSAVACVPTNAQAGYDSYSNQVNSMPAISVR